MEKNLFDSFEKVSSKQWKQKIQYELKGADYNDTLVWESLEGIKVKPFYHLDDRDFKSSAITTAEPFSILQNIFVHDVSKSNKRALETLNRGAESIRFTIDNELITIEELMEHLPKKDTVYFFYLSFISTDFVNKLSVFGTKNDYHFIVQLDPIHQLGKDGNWFENLDKDFKKLNEINKKATTSYLNVNSTLYQNAGANMVQQLAYSLAHVNEYFNRISEIKRAITIEVAIGSNYFFEIAKLRALRILFNTLSKEYNHNLECKIIATPSKRNKTLYDYNVNLLRTTTECMSAVLGNSDYIANLPYDSLYHKDNEFGDRIARNQLLILKHESYFDVVNNAADGSYYIEEVTNQLAEKALLLFKEIEANGGFIAQLIEGTIQKKISESNAKEQEWFDSGKEVLLGTNKHPNKDDKMKHDLELYPFVKQNPRKTLITPIIEKRLAEKMEQERLATE